MAVTRNKANQAAGKILQILAEAYKDSFMVIASIVRATVKGAKEVGTAPAREIALKILQELYTLNTGLDPVGDRRFKRWVRRALSITSDPIEGVDQDDAEDATLGGIN